MSKDLFVRITYRNEKQEPISDKDYSQKDYADMLRLDLLRVISDVEDLVYRLNDHKPKSEWNDEVWSAFCHIKHKILDKAGDIGRLPENIHEQDDW